MISVEAARRMVLEHVVPMADETVPLSRLLGRVLAEDVVATFPSPPFDNSAMDGYAVRAASLAGASSGSPVRLPIAFESAAGGAPLAELPPGAAARIMTGAMVPVGADTVIRLEETQEADGYVTCFAAARAGAHVRRAGEDFAIGTRVLATGSVLTPGRMALLAGVGRPQARVRALPTVAILSTGDELVEPGQPLGPGQIYASNVFALAAMVAEVGALPVVLERTPDDALATRTMLERAQQCDVVVASGGVSRGRYDFVGATMAELGQIHFDRVAQQPGKPFTFATLGNKPVFGLPGNPVSSLVSFEVYVRPALRRMMGHPEADRARVAVIAREEIQTSPGLTTFLRSRLRWDGSTFEARWTGPQGSGLISSMAQAQALVIVGPERGHVRAGDRLEALLLGSPEELFASHAAEEG